MKILRYLLLMIIGCNCQIPSYSDRVCRAGTGDGTCEAIDYNQDKSLAIKMIKKTCFEVCHDECFLHYYKEVK
jgi:hypothetical protein